MGIEAPEEWVLKCEQGTFFCKGVVIMFTVELRNGKHLRLRRIPPQHYQLPTKYRKPKKSAAERADAWAQKMEEKKQS